MPLCLEPNQRFPIVLDIDADKPIDTRPTFFVVSLSMREQMKLSAGMDAALSHDKTEAIFDATCKLLDDYLVGWTNMGPHDFAEACVKDFLTHGEARELLRKILSNSHVSFEDKKSSE
jgi:hypothetical protein